MTRTLADAERALGRAEYALDRRDIGGARVALRTVRRLLGEHRDECRERGLPCPGLTLDPNPNAGAE